MNIDNRKKDDELESSIDEALNDDTPSDDTLDTVPADNEQDAPNEDVEETPQEEPEEDDEDTDVDYEEKFKSSSKEAMSLFFKNKHLNDKIDEAANLAEPTEDDLKQYAVLKGADWEMLDTFSKNILKDSYVNDRRFSLIHEASKAGREFEAWEKKVVDFIDSPETLAKYPVMSDYGGRFKRFCMKEGRMGMSLDDLLASFLFHQEQDGRTKVSKKKKTMFLSGGSGGEEPIKPAKMTADQVRAIRATDPKRYRQMIKEGKIGMDVLEAE